MIVFVSKFFWKAYLNGYVVEILDEKMEYRLRGFFPNNIAKTKARNVLKKDLN